MTKKLYVGNLPFAADEAGLRAHFEADGRKVDSVKIMMDRETGRSRGFAFVEMSTPEEAQQVIAALNNKDFMGRPLMINEAREQAPRPGSGFGGPRPGGFGGGGPRPSGFSGPRPSGGGFSGPRPGGGGFAPPTGGGFEPPPEDKGGRSRRDFGKDKDRDRRKRDKGGDDW
jgi:RNA recognition motif-containing protein